MGQIVSRAGSSFSEKVVRIFLIEDDKLDQMQVQRALRQKGVLSSLNVFNEAEGAYEELQLEDSGSYPDIILLDLNMPRMNGIEFLRAIRQHEKFSALKIFVLSNSDRERDECEKLGVSGYILKPLKLNSPTTDTISLLIDMMNL
jgi:CheY-like chemotaxis protein